MPIFRMFQLVSIIVIAYIVIYGCCDPNKPVITIKPFHRNLSIDLKGFDTNCDGDINYWQHYKNDREIGSKIYTERIMKTNDID